MLVPERRSWFVSTLFPFRLSQRLTISIANCIDKSRIRLSDIKPPINNEMHLRAWNDLSIMKWDTSHLMKCALRMEWNLPIDTYEPQSEDCGSFHSWRSQVFHSLAYFICLRKWANFIAVAEASITLTLPQWQRQRQQSYQPFGIK